MAGTPPPGDEDAAGAPVLPWRLVAGALLHFVLPAYLLTLAVAAAVGRPAHAALLGFAGAVSWRFCLAYAALAVAASLVAALADPPLRRARARREARDPAAPARTSARQVARALRDAEAIGGARVAAAVAALRAAGWDHRDERTRAVAADLARAASAFAAAHASAPAAERGRVAELAADALERMAAAVDDLAAERARLDHGDALTHARYIEQRYRPSTLDSVGPDRD